MSPVELPWGNGSLDVALPRRWTVLGELLPKRVPEPKNVIEACTDALAHPVGARPLSERDLSSSRVVVVTDDHSRPTPVAAFLPAVLDQLARAGARDDDIDILLANGVHRESRIDEVEKKLGPDVAARFRWRCHSIHRPEEISSVGTTSRGTPVHLNTLLCQADLIVCLGAIEPHLLAGFGGGLKLIVPGCAGAETIGHNHMQGVDPDNFDFVGADLDTLPMRLDLEEAARMLGKELFIVNVAMNERAKPTRFFCGDPIRAHRGGVDFVNDLVRLEVPQQSDVVLTNSFPMDGDLRQSAKCLGNSLYASKQDGVMLACAYCEHGLGEMPIPKKTLPYILLRLLVNVIGKQRVLPLVERIKAGEPIEEIFIGHFGLQMLRRNHLGLFSEILPADIGQKVGLARTFNDVQEMIRWSTRWAPQDATVWVFPFGGATYAALASHR
jgi:nickel-dependent lactate racemase